MPQDPAIYSNILIELLKAVKMHNFYPNGHPNLDSALEKCYSPIKKLTTEEGEIKWRIDQKGFFVGKTQIAVGNADVTALAKKIFFRRINEITFTSRITIEDMKVLLSVLKLEPDEIAKKDGAEGIFAINGVQGILLNAMTFEDLSKLKDELDEKRNKKEQAQKDAEKQELEQGKTAKEEEPPPPPDEKKPDDEDLSTLIERIREEHDTIKYKDLCVRIKERCSRLIAEKKYDDVSFALLVLVIHTTEAWHRPQEIKDMAADCLQACLTDDMLHYLIDRVAKKVEPMRPDIQRILLLGGERAVEFLLDAVISAQEAIARRHYYNIIILNGPSIRPNVEKRLQGAEWFVIRQMVSILGDLGDTAAIDALESAYTHTDGRVKKEVLKSLVKLPSERSTAALIKALDETDESLVCHAIISLGMLKDTSSIDLLARIAMKRDAFSEPKESVKEAIKALGNIGHPKAVPCLRDILLRNVWLGKRSNEELQILAVNSLALIGSPEAYDALEMALKKSLNGELYNICKRLLDGRDKRS